jgi:radical SAM protein with 4Fe4S-binding SPASM domain
MSPKQMEHILSKLVDVGIKQVTFGGGEPLLYPDLTKWVEWLSKQGIVVNITSNGFFLSQELAYELADCGLNQIQMNVESIEPHVHDWVRGKEGAYKRVLAAIKHALEANLVVVSQIVVTSENLSNILHVVAFSRRLGVQRARVWDMTPSGLALEHPKLFPQGYIDMLSRLVGLAHEMGAVKIQSYEPLFPLGIQVPFKLVHVPCPSRLGLLMHVAVDGTVYYCCTFTEMYNINDVKGGSKLTKLHQQKIASFNQNRHLQSICAQCDFEGICRGGCPIRADWGGGIDYQCRKIMNGLTLDKLVA